MQYISKGNTYILSEEFLSFLHEWKGYLVVFGGSSGSGKTTLSEGTNYPTIKSLTTREKRKLYETYDFISDNVFQELRSNKSFASLVVYQKDKYGFTLEHFKSIAENNKVICVALNPTIYKMLKTRYSRTIGVFVDVDFENVKKRLLSRDGFLDEVRIASFKNNNRSKSFYHIKINNNNSFIFKQIFLIKFNLLVIRLLDKSKKTHKLRKKLYFTERYKIQRRKGTKNSSTVIHPLSN